MAEDTTQEQIAAAPKTTEEGHPLAEGEPSEYFPTPQPEANLFEIGLVLGGTGATGPYTAGVLDFLIQALDEWEKHRVSEKDKPKTDWKVPHHKVRIRIITGTSGGGICSLLTARALHYAFPPAVDRTPATTLAANPFYDIWVNDIKIDKFLDCSDLVGNPVPQVRSALNGQLLETIAANGLSYPSPTQYAAIQNMPKPERTYVNNPLPVIVTHSNLTGIPYRQPFGGNAVSAEYFTNHADFVRIYFDYSPLSTPPGQGKLVPGGMFVASPIAKTPTRTPPGLHSLQWDLLSPFALGTAAIPAGLPARQISRSVLDYAYRFSWDTVSQKYSWLVPDWKKFVPSGGWASYGFVSLDGGCTDNEPVALARQTLEGLTPPLAQAPVAPAAQPQDTAKPWDMDNANRAIVLVDPLCEIPHDSTDAMSVALVSTLPRAVDMFKQTNRFATADICDFLHPAVHNRFLVAPRRSNPNPTPTQPSACVEGATALCGEGLGAFLGFLSPTFRHHDFMLGRYNCQSFLEHIFTLSEENDIFLNTPNLTTRLGTRPTANLPQGLGGYNGFTAPQGQYPIIPLCGSAADFIQEPSWPQTGSLDPETLRAPVEKRAGKIMESFSQLLPLKLYQKPFLNFGIWWMKARAADKFLEMVNAALNAKHL